MTAIKCLTVVFAISCPVSLIVGKYIAAGKGPEIEDEAEKETAA